MALLEIQVAKYFNVSTKVWLNQLVSNLSKPLPNLLHNGRYDDRSRTVYYTSSDDILTTVNDNDVDISEGILWILMAPFFYLVFLIFLGSVIICFLSLKDRRFPTFVLSSHENLGDSFKKFTFENIDVEICRPSNQYHNASKLRYFRNDQISHNDNSGIHSSSRKQAQHPYNGHLYQTVNNDGNVIDTNYFKNGVEKCQKASDYKRSNDQLISTRLQKDELHRNNKHVSSLNMDMKNTPRRWRASCKLLITSANESLPDYNNCFNNGDVLDADVSINEPSGTSRPLTAATNENDVDTLSLPSSICRFHASRVQFPVLKPDAQYPLTSTKKHPYYLPGDATAGWLDSTYYCIETVDQFSGNTSTEPNIGSSYSSGQGSDMFQTLSLSSDNRLQSAMRDMKTGNNHPCLVSHITSPSYQTELITEVKDNVFECLRYSQSPKDQVGAYSNIGNSLITDDLNLFSPIKEKHHIIKCGFDVCNVGSGQNVTCDLDSMSLPNDSEQCRQRSSHYLTSMHCSEEGKHGCHVILSHNFQPIDCKLAHQSESNVCTFTPSMELPLGGRLTHNPTFGMYACPEKTVFDSTSTKRYFGCNCPQNTDAMNYGGVKLKNTRECFMKTDVFCNKGAKQCAYDVKLNHIDVDHGPKATTKTIDSTADNTKFESCNSKFTYSPGTSKNSCHRNHVDHSTSLVNSNSVQLCTIPGKQNNALVPNTCQFCKPCVSMKKNDSLSRIASDSHTPINEADIPSQCLLSNIGNSFCNDILQAMDHDDACTAISKQNLMNIPNTMDCLSNLDRNYQLDSEKNTSFNQFPCLCTDSESLADITKLLFQDANDIGYFEEEMVLNGVINEAYRFSQDDQMVHCAESNSNMSSYNKHNAFFAEELIPSTFAEDLFGLWSLSTEFGEHVSPYHPSTNLMTPVNKTDIKAGNKFIWECGNSNSSISSTSFLQILKSQNGDNFEEVMPISGTDLLHCHSNKYTIDAVNQDNCLCVNEGPMLLNACEKPSQKVGSIYRHTKNNSSDANYEDSDFNSEYSSVKLRSVNINELYSLCGNIEDKDDSMFCSPYGVRIGQNCASNSAFYASLSYEKYISSNVEISPIRSTSFDSVSFNVNGIDNSNIREYWL